MKTINTYINEKLVIGDNLDNYYCEEIYEFARKYDIVGDLISSGFSGKYDTYEYDITNSEILKIWDNKFFKYLDDNNNTIFTNIKDITNKLNIDKKYNIYLISSKISSKKISRLVIKLHTVTKADMVIVKTPNYNNMSIMIIKNKNIEKTLMQIIDYILEIY